MDLLPRPLRYRATSGTAVLADGMVIAADEAAWPVACLLASELEASTGWRVGRGGPDAQSPNGIVRLRVVGRGQVPDFPGPEREAYRLSVRPGATGSAGATGSPGVIEVTAPSLAGAFYGTRTLRQLLPPDLLRSAPVNARAEVRVQGVEVEDRPRFGWRGVGLDVARHFFPKDFLLRLVDLASLHKLNLLHLHLTDDQGWRFQVNAYPRLTEVGAWRRQSPAGHHREGRKDGTPHGGFYTQADLAEVVAYARQRHMAVLPEVDMPGHMQAAIASYPELGNTGERLEVGTDWGVSEHVLNLGPTAMRFCQEVLGELMDVFPGPYVHVGGDECPTAEWQSSAEARQLCARVGLAGPHQLQGWFTAQMAEVLAANGRRLVGWDEIFDAGAPTGSVIMAWERERAWRVGTQAAHAGHDVVMVPEPWCYFDWAYAEDPREPLAIRAGISVEQAYGLEPVPKDLEAPYEQRVLGTQGQLWTEYVPTPRHAEYMYFPRLCALAEVAWSGREREWLSFQSRLEAHLARLDALGVNYRPLAGPTPGQARTWGRGLHPGLHDGPHAPHPGWGPGAY